MKADSITIAKVFSSGGDIHYILPHFQREYTWQRNDWQTLLDDALLVYAEARDSQLITEHFLGSIVVVSDGTRAGTVAAYRLVDGQQRLTTISLLLKAVGTLVPDALWSKKIDRHLLNTEESGDVHFKILPTTKSGDRAAYCAILHNQPVPTEGRASSIPAAYLFFRHELGRQIAAGLEIERFLPVILNAFQVVFVNLNQNESPYRIFESLNGKGRALTQGDLVRNYVAMTLPSDRQEVAFNRYWSPLEAMLQEKRKVGKLTELTAFLRHYLAAKNGVLCHESHVYARFRDRAEHDFDQADSFECELAEIARYAQYYDYLLRPEKLPSGPLARALARLNVLEASPTYPLLLHLFAAKDRGELLEPSMVECLTVVENYLIRRFLVGEPSNYLAQVFPRLWAEIDRTNLVASLRLKLGGSKYPSDGRLLRTLQTRELYDKNAATRRRVVLVLETLNRHLSEGSGGFTVLDAAATIEHVMPQTLSNEWKMDLGPMSEQVHRDCLHILGNLTLVTGEWNSELSNARFGEKRPKLAANALRLNSNYFGDPLPRWSRTEIRERTEILADKVVALWPSLSPVPEADAPLARDPMSEFEIEVAERLSQKLGISFSKVSQSRFEAKNSNHRLVGLCSKPYRQNELRTHFWFGLKVGQRAFLEESPESWLLLQCGTRERALAIPYATFQPWLRLLNETEGVHRHINLIEQDGQINLRLPQSEGPINLTDYLV